MLDGGYSMLDARYSMHDSAGACPPEAEKYQVKAINSPGNWYGGPDFRRIPAGPT
jgi:hypothetical protein